ncbi:MAG: HD domain-containing phosphohydrolase, partial [Nitrospirota bacterium]
AFKSKGLHCWLSSGTHCRNEIHGKFLDKMIDMCLDCEVFKANIDAQAIKETIEVVNKGFREFKTEQGLSEVFDALEKISSGDPSIRISETSENELISKLKHVINLTAESIEEIVDLSHEFAVNLAEHFDVLNRVSRGDLDARVNGISQVELLESLKKVTNQMIDSVSIQISERKQCEKELDAIVTVSAALRTARSRAEIMSLILDQLIDLLQAEGAALAIRDLSNSDSIIELAKGAWEKWEGLRLPRGEGVSGYVIDTGQQYLNNNVLDDPRFAWPERVADLHAVACIPLIAEEQTIGALWLGRKADINECELRLLMAVANIAANAIQRVTLNEQTDRSIRRLAALHTIDISINASLDLHLTLNVLLEQVTDQLGVDATDVLLLNPYTQTMEFVSGRGFRSRALRHTHLQLGQGHAGRAALERHIVGITNLSEFQGDFVRSPFLSSEGFKAYYAAPLIAKGQVKGVLEIFHRSPLSPDLEWLDFLEALAAQAAIAIDNAFLFNDLQRANTELTIAYDATIAGWSRALDMRDRETEGHTQRVMEMTLRLAQAVGMSGAELVHVRRGALLHDIGKMSIPDGILIKPGPLTEEEWEIMRKHPVFAYEMLSPVAFLLPALDIPYCHHEKWDGSGYPRGLKGEQIPLAARIFAVVDVWDALRSDRPYRSAWPEEKVREYISEQSGKHFDPKVLELFLEMEWKI